MSELDIRHSTSKKARNVAKHGAQRSIVQLQISTRDRTKKVVIAPSIPRVDSLIMNSPRCLVRVSLPHVLTKLGKLECVMREHVEIVQPSAKVHTLWNQNANLKVTLQVR